MTAGLPLMLDEGGFQLFRLSGLGHFGQCLEDLVFSEVDVLERVVKHVAQQLCFLGHTQLHEF